ncbi:MAG TPA: hypothetical protein ENI39_02235 [Anaerolineae bacterium]|nr:hypothetical protein [Anaerolineae bacterium]
MTERENLNRITESIIAAAIEAHRALGPGLLESAYEACLTGGFLPRLEVGGFRRRISMNRAIGGPNVVSIHPFWGYSTDV